MDPRLLRGCNSHRGNGDKPNQRLSVQGKRGKLMTLSFLFQDGLEKNSVNTAVHCHCKESW